MGDISGTTADFPVDAAECSTFGHTFSYGCGGGDTYTTSFEWKTLYLTDNDGLGATVFAPVVGTSTVISEITGIAVTGSTGPTGDSINNIALIGGNLRIYITDWRGDPVTDFDLGNVIGPTGATGATGNTGPTGPNGLTFSSITNDVFVYVANKDSDPPELGGISADIFTYLPDIPQVEATFLKENPTSITPSKGGSLTINRNSYKNNTVIVNMNGNLQGITLQNFGTGDYISLIMKQPSDDVHTFNSEFSQPSIGSGTFKFAGGLTLALGNTYSDIDVFYLYCYDEHSFLVNHQQFHDGV